MKDVNDLELLRLLDKFRDNPDKLDVNEYKLIYQYINKLENIVIIFYKNNRELKNRNNELNNLLLDIKERIL